MYARAILLATAALAVFDKASALTSASNYAKSVSLPLDHFGTNKDVFKNRFWVYDEAYKPGGPVILSDAGEANGYTSYTNLKGSLGASVANSTNGLLIHWEHRYYGESVPTISSTLAKTLAVNSETLGTYYKYLDVEQALEDVVYLAKSFKWEGKDLSASKVPWVFIGGSYPGARAAWIRKRNPETIFASWASSAVVEVTVELPEYGQTYYDYFEKTGKKACMNDVREFIKFMNNIYTTKDYKTYKAFIQSYITNGPTNTAWTNSNAEFYFNWVMEYIWGRGFQNGNTKGGEEFCTWITEAAIADNPTKASIINKSGVTVGLGSFNKTLPYIQKVLKTRHEKRISARSVKLRRRANEATLIPECTAGSISSCTEFISERAWIYQVCSEMGWEQNDSTTLDYAWQHLSSDTAGCVEEFGTSVSKGPTLKPQSYGGMKGMNPSNTFWVDGEYDPWRAATPNAEDSGRKPSSSIPKAGEVLAGNEFFGALIKDGFHCPIHACREIVLAGEKKLDPKANALITATDVDCKPGVAEAHQLFLDALHSWLPSFKGATTPTTSTQKSSTTGKAASSSKPAVNNASTTSKAASSSKPAAYNASATSKATTPISTSVATYKIDTKPNDENTSGGTTESVNKTDAEDQDFEISFGKQGTLKVSKEEGNHNNIFLEADVKVSEAVAEVMKAGLRAKYNVVFNNDVE